MNTQQRANEVASVGDGFVIQQDARLLNAPKSGIVPH